MELLLAKKYWMHLYLENEKFSTQLTLTVFVESRSGRLNTETGTIIPIKELDECVNEAIAFVSGKSIKDVKGLAYLPHTLEVIATRLWEHIEESMNYKARLAKIRLTREPDFFVEYVGRDTQEPPRTKKKKSED